jgi:hypothetical protein
LYYVCFLILEYDFLLCDDDYISTPLYDSSNLKYLYGGRKKLSFQGIRARMCADVRNVKLVHHCHSEELIWWYMQ